MLPPSNFNEHHAGVEERMIRMVFNIYYFSFASCSFVVVGALRRACFECETVEERNKWVEALRAVIDYNIKVNAMEGKVEEEKPIDEDDEDFL